MLRAVELRGVFAGCRGMKLMEGEVLRFKFVVFQASKNETWNTLTPWES
jgi:hypothetical protein